MVASRTQIGIIAGTLIVFGLGLTLYKSISLGLPLVPSQYRDVWTIESKVSFQPSEGAVEVLLTLPEQHNGWVTLNENYSSSGFGFTVREDDFGSHARWTKKTVTEPTLMYYKAQVYQDSSNLTPPGLSTTLPSQRKLTHSEKKAFGILVKRLREKSSDDESFVSQLLLEFLDSENNQDIQFILRSAHQGKTDAIQQLLSMGTLLAVDIGIDTPVDHPFNQFPFLFCIQCRHTIISFGTI